MRIPQQTPVLQYIEYSRFSRSARSGIYNAQSLTNVKIREGDRKLMENWSWDQWLHVGIFWLGLFAVVGGIVSLTSGGLSGRGFIEGLWKGVEWFFIVLIVIAVGYGALLVLGLIGNALNSSW